MTSTDRITPAEIEAKLSELAESLDETVEDKRETVKKVAIVAILALIVLAFLLGRRRGQQSKTIVEIRRL